MVGWALRTATVDPARKTSLCPGSVGTASVPGGAIPRRNASKVAILENLCRWSSTNSPRSIERWAVQVVIGRAWRLPAEIAVRAVLYECWRCGTDDFAVACMQDGELAGPYDVVYTSNELPLAYARYLLIVAGHQRLWRGTFGLKLVWAES